MKWFMFCMAISVVFFSCNPDDNSGTANDIQQNDLTGNWKIKELIDNDKDETYHFTGYIFTFSNSTVTAVKAGVSVSGIHTLSSGSNGSRELKMIFPETEPWDELNEDWTVLEWNQNMLKLRHVSGGNGGTDNLIFEKVN